MHDPLRGIAGQGDSERRLEGCYVLLERSAQGTTVNTCRRAAATVTATGMTSSRVPKSLLGVALAVVLGTIGLPGFGAGVGAWRREVDSRRLRRRLADSVAAPKSTRDRRRHPQRVANCWPGCNGAWMPWSEGTGPALDAQPRRLQRRRHSSKSVSPTLRATQKARRFAHSLLPARWRFRKPRAPIATRWCSLRRPRQLASDASFKRGSQW